MLFVWDAQLARECARIVTKRARFCDRLKALAADAHKRLTDGKEIWKYLTSRRLREKTPRRGKKARRFF